MMMMDVVSEYDKLFWPISILLFFLSCPNHRYQFVVVGGNSIDNDGDGVDDGDSDDACAV